MVKATIVVDDYALKGTLIAEHGLAIYIEIDNKKILFDTAGSSISVFNNCSALGIDPTQINTIILSHGHYDHTSALPSLLKIKPEIDIYSGDIKNFFNHYAKGREKAIYAGPPLDQTATKVYKWHEVKEFTQLSPNLWLTGYVPREEKFSPFDKRLVSYNLKENRYEKDLIKDDLSIVIRGENGYSVILGCAHAGFINILRHISKNLNTNKFFAVIGGTHLVGQEEEFTKQLIETAEKEFDINYWYPCHCTTIKGISTFLKLLPQKTKICGAGSVINL